MRGFLLIILDLGTSKITVCHTHTHTHTLWHHFTAVPAKMP